MASNYQYHLIDEKTPLASPPPVTHYCPAAQGLEVAAALREAQRQQERSRRRRRIVKAFLITAVATFVLVKLAMIAATAAHHHGPFLPPHGHPGHGGDHSNLFAIPGDLEVQDGPSFEDQEPSPSTTFTFNIPTDSNKIFVVAHGPLAKGDLKIVQGDEGDEVKVDVTTIYDGPDQEWLARHVKVCALQGKEDENEKGVGIFTRRRHHRPPPKFTVRFDVLVTFPKSKNGEKLDIHKFVADLGVFSINAGALAPGIEFKSFILNTVVEPIKIGSVFADHAVIHTANGAIIGSFNATDTLILESANAPIIANVTLTNEKYPKYATVVLQTANAAINSNITLVNGTANPGNFMVKPSTAQAPLTVNVVDAPAGSTLLLTASTALEPNTVSLPSTYEGVFGLATSLGSANVTVNETAVDPLPERHRARQVVYEQVSKWNVRGYVIWEGDEAGKTRGQVNLSTVLSNVTLTLR